jgi:hypothetical protein
MAPGLDNGNRVNAKPKGGSEGPQQRDIASPLPAETEVFAHHKGTHLKLSAEHLLDKRLCSELGKRLLESEQDDGIHPEPLKAQEAVSPGKHARRCLLGLKEGAGMRMKAQERRLMAARPRERNRLMHQSEMPQVQAVEASNGENSRRRSLARNSDRGPHA